MGRPIRIEFPGAFYHVMIHASGKQWIYKNSEHLSVFINGLIEMRRKYGVLVHAAVLMLNHFHLLIETPGANLSRVMKRFNAEFARKMNILLHRKGVLFQKRFKAILIEKGEYYRNLLRYLAQNPVRAGVVKRCEEYSGSFVRWISDPVKRKAIYWDDIQSEFSGGGTWQNNFLNAVNGEFEASPYNSRIHTVMLGSKDWAEEISRKYPPSTGNKPQGARKYDGMVFSETRLMKFLDSQSPKDREELELQIRFECSGQTIGEITKKMKLKSYHACAQKLYRLRKRLKNDKRFTALVEKGIKNVKS